MQAITLEFLQKAHFSLEQARYVAQAIETEIEVRKDTLATKLDLQEAKTDIIRTLASWMLTAFLAQTGIILGVMYFFLTHVKS